MFDWDEVNFAECAREMVISGNYSLVQLNYQPFWEKPPFFIWLQALSMNAFGINEFAARFPNAVCSIISFISIFLIGKKFHSQKFGLLWCLVYGSLLLPHLYFKSGIIDPWFNLFIFLSVYNIVIFINNPSGRREIFNALLAGFFVGMAVLTKGPAALVIVAFTVIAAVLWSRNFKALLSKTFLVFMITGLLVSLSWFIFEWMRGNSLVIKEFITYQIRLFKTGDAGHDGPFFYHFVVLLVGCFPASFLFIAGYGLRSGLTPFQLLFRKFFIALFWVVLILFSVVKTKIVHYSSICYYPITFIATLAIIQYFDRIKFRSALRILYWLVTAVITIAFTAVGFTEKLKGKIIDSGLIKEEFVKGNLRADVHWSGFEFLIGFVFLAGAIFVFLSVNRKKIRWMYYGLICNLLFIYLAIVVIIPKVELYTQHAAIEFYKACSRHKCYVETHSYKSYAYLFYSNRLPEDYQNPDQVSGIETLLKAAVEGGHMRHSSYPTANCYWMKHGPIDRPAFIVAKKDLEHEMLSAPGFNKLYEKNGFCFFVRMPVVK